MNVGLSALSQRPYRPSDPASRGHPAITKSVKFELVLPSRSVETSGDRIRRHKVSVFHGVFSDGTCDGMQIPG